MIYGMGTGILWAMETTLLSILLSKGTITQTRQAIFLTPFICAFLNDLISGIWVFIFRKTSKITSKDTVIEVLRKKKGKVLLLSGLFGGPLGMSAYLLSIKYIGVPYTTAISALFPVIGAIIASIFLKDRLTRLQQTGIILCSFGVLSMIGTNSGMTGNVFYCLFSFACALFWGLEAVLTSYAMKDGEASYETALQIRHGTSVICYVIFFLPMLKAWGVTLQIASDASYLLPLLLTGLLETGSYLMYYKAISRIGAARAMSLNITYMVWAVLFEILIYKKIPENYVLISSLVLLSGVVLVALFEADRKKSVL